MTEPTFLDRVRRRAKREIKQRNAALNERLTSDEERHAKVINGFRALPNNDIRQDVIDRFHQIYYDDGPDHEGTWRKTTWLGTIVWKNPFDLWLYQEIIHRIKPDLIIETGTAFGGSALYMAAICDINGRGSVVSVDLDPKPNLPPHPRVRYVTSSSVAPEIVAELTELARGAETVLVVLDSDHSQQHVAAEIAAFAPLVTVGSYLIVEDTNINGNPVYPNFGPGPMEATREFLAGHPEFEPDPEADKFLVTFNPKGVLKRLPDAR
jgi:cephalosporin hydroxylase